MFEFIVHIMDIFGYLGVIFLIAIENIFPPIPSEVILTFAGFMTTFTRLSVFGITIFATVGSMLGAFVLYYIGYAISPEKMKRIVGGPVGNLLGLKQENIDSAVEWFNSRGKYTVFFCRFIPIVRSLISIPAGMARMDIGVFSLLTTVGSFIWNIVLISLGAFAGESWPLISVYARRYSFGGKCLLGALLVLWLVKHIRKRLL